MNMGGPVTAGPGGGGGLLESRGMRGRFRAWRDRRLIARHPIAEAHWRRALRHCGPARRLAPAEQAALRVLVTRFLQRKAIEPVGDLELDASDRVLLAVHACVPILKLGMDWYRGWHSVIVYPDVFMPRRERMDAAGVVHASRDMLAGEAWSRGPVIVSWTDVLEGGRQPGRNVVIHEMAHKLDMLEEGANGYPPLHRGMDRRQWAQVFTDAWRRLHADAHAGQELPVDRYALESPAEFFAVLSEQYFEAPDTLREHLPAVYAQLARFYRRSDAIVPVA